MKTPDSMSNSRLDRELERERQQRHKHDEEKAGIGTEDDFRGKDARDSSSSGNLHRCRSR